MSTVQGETLSDRTLLFEEDTVKSFTHIQERVVLSDQLLMVLLKSHVLFFELAAPSHERFVFFLKSLKCTSMIFPCYRTSHSKMYTEGVLETIGIKHAIIGWQKER